MNPRQSVLLPLFFVVCLGIVYGSLFPFHFATDLHPRAIPRFLASWSKINSAGDILGNIVLFVPYGYLACLIVARTGRSVLAMLSLGFTLALVCQALQLFTPGRDPSLFDLLMNSLGVALGWAGGVLLPLGSRSKIMGGNTAQHLALLLALAWIVGQLLPLVPSIDLQSWKDSLKPLLFSPRLRWSEAFLTASAWLCCFYLLQHRVGVALGARRLISGALALLLLKVIVVVNYLTFSATLGLAVSVFVWLLWGRQLQGQSLAWLLLAAFVFDALAPLYVHTTPQNFSWIPFSGYLQGSMLVNAMALTRKGFIFGVVVLILVRPRSSPWRWAAGFTCVLLVVEVLQRYIGLGTPALTDPLLFLTMMWFVQKQLAHARHPVATN